MSAQLDPPKASVSSDDVGVARGRTGFLHSIVEWFLYLDARAIASIMPASTRAAAVDALFRARQKHDAARALFLHGSHSEALTLAADAYRSAVAAEELVRPMLGSSKNVHAALVIPQALPETDAQVTLEHTRLLERLLQRSHAVDTALSPYVMNERYRMWMRALHLGATLLLAAAFLGGMAIAWRLLRLPTVHGSASYSAQYNDAMAIDGIEETEWLLPDGTPGQLDLGFRSPRRLRSIRLLNAYNWPALDRATKDYSVELYRSGKLLKSYDRTFEAGTSKHEWHTINIDVGTPVDLVRVVVKSSYGLGGGIAEVVLK